MSYRCCSLIERFALNFNRRIDTGEPCLSLCCENLDHIPKIKFADTAEDSLRTFAGEGLLTAIECAQVKEDSKRPARTDCYEVYRPAGYQRHL